MSRSFARWVFAIAAFAGTTSALAAEPPRAIIVTQSRGFDHDVVKPRDGQPSRVDEIFDQLAAQTKLFTVEKTRDASILTPEKLKTTKLIVFYTSGELPMTAEQFKAFDQWLKDGGAFLGIHSATDTFHQPPNHDGYNKIINGEFEQHPWTLDDTVTLKVLDDQHPATKGFPQGFTHKEEIYLFKNFDPGQVRVLIALDMEKTAKKKPRYVPVAWCKNYEKGKVFYTSLGHRDDVWTDPIYQKHLTGAIRWLLDVEKGDATPNADVSNREEEISKKAAEAAGQTLASPRIQEGFTCLPFVKAPDIHSPASITVSADGRIFVGEDEYNSGGKIEPSTSRVKLCVDTDGDGKADKITVFADKLNSPQGLHFAGGVLYVMHAPLLTAFRDTNGDGVADAREDLVTGLGPTPEGLVHHIPSGLRMGPDGWIYVSIGDKGIVKATAKDKSTISLHGGGVVRLLPDGTNLQIFSHHTRNTFDVAIDPYLNIFTRDNTNDGGGWWSRIAHMQRDAEYGYPSLYINFADEIIPAIGDYGSGSATGSVYVHEPGFPSGQSDRGNCLYACDWARGILYRHDFAPRGATFSVSQDEFVKGVTPTDVDVDASGSLYLADWGRRDWGNAGPVGTIYRIKHDGEPQPPMPDVTKLTHPQLLELITSPSMTRRREALCEIVARSQKVKQPELISGLTRIALKPGELYARIAALLALARVQGEDAQGTLSMLASNNDLREYALRALTDRDDIARAQKPELFLGALSDRNPRVRVQAAIAMGHLLPTPATVNALIPLTADSDVMVRHAAMQSLRRLNAIDALSTNLKSQASNSEIASGILRTLRTLHDEKSVTAVGDFLDTNPAPALRRDALKSLSRLYQKPAAWDGSWWTPRPDTKGPWFKSEAWAGTPQVGRRLVRAIDDADAETANLAIFTCGLCRIPDAAPGLSRMVTAGTAFKEEAAKALIDGKFDKPDALAALEKVILTDGFKPEIRMSAAQALGAIDSAQPIIVRVLPKLATVKDPPAGLLDKLTESLSAKPPLKNASSEIAALLDSANQNIRFAAGTCLARSAEEPVRSRVLQELKSDQPQRVEAILIAISRLPVDLGKPYRESINALVHDKRDPVRQSATVALGHLGDASAVKELLVLARHETNPMPVVSALADIAPQTTADDQLLPIAEILVENSVKASKTAESKETYTKLVSAAQKFLADPRVPTTQASTLLSQLKQPGVISDYLATDPLPIPEIARAFQTPLPPESAPAGPFVPFSHESKQISFKPMSVKDPEGKQRLEMPANSVMYLIATVEIPVATQGLLTFGSDDGIGVWVNGKPVATKDVDRGLTANQDRATVPLNAGKNILLFKVVNRGGHGGVQARLRSRPTEFDNLEDLGKFIAKLPTASPSRGRELFTSANVGCIKCHTLEPTDEPKGPYLGDAGAKFPASHLIESVLHPSAKIAQGFQSELVIVKSATGGSTDYTGFPVKESADELIVRDATGRVSTIAKSSIKSRRPLAGSIMPEGLADQMTLDDFASLMAFLQSLKTTGH